MTANIDSSIQFLLVSYQVVWEGSLHHVDLATTVELRYNTTRTHWPHQLFVSLTLSGLGKQQQNGNHYTFQTDQIEVEHHRVNYVLPCTNFCVKKTIFTLAKVYSQTDQVSNSTGSLISVISGASVTQPAQHAGNRRSPKPRTRTLLVQDANHAPLIANP